MLLTSKYTKVNFILLIIPTLTIFGVSLWLTILWRYPSGLSEEQLETHIILFGIIGLIWLALYYAFGLFDLRARKQFIDLISSLLGATALGLVGAIVIFYFQPELI